MRVKALKMESVVPVTVTMRSGQEPSLMLILAPLCKTTRVKTRRSFRAKCQVEQDPFQKRVPRQT